MKIETFPTAEFREEEEYDMQEALNNAGLFDVVPPREGTPAYARLVEAAKGYMAEVKRMESSSTTPQTDSENYFSNRKPVPSPSDTERRMYHNQLAKMLLGGTRKGLSKEQASQLSDFAAYLTGHEEYIGTW